MRSLEFRYESSECSSAAGSRPSRCVSHESESSLFCRDEGVDGQAELGGQSMNAVRTLHTLLLAPMV